MGDVMGNIKFMSIYLIHMQHIKCIRRSPQSFILVVEVIRPILPVHG